MPWLLWCTGGRQSFAPFLFWNLMGAKDCLTPEVNVIWISGRVAKLTFDCWSNMVFEQSLLIAWNGKDFRDCRRFIRPLWRFDARQRPRVEKLTIVRALPGISRRLDLLERIYDRFPLVDRIDCFVWVPNLGKYTAVSTKVVPQKRKSVRDNADWNYG